LEHQYLTPTEVASQLRVAARTLANWRSLKMGPPHTKIGGRVLYARVDLDRHLVAGAVRPPPQPRAAEEWVITCKDERFVDFYKSLSRRAQTAVRNRPIRFSQLRGLSSDDLKGIPNCGSRTIEEILVAARSHAPTKTQRSPVLAPTKTQRSSSPLDEELARLVKRHGLRLVLASIANLATE
jgi:hypothetical protein